MPIYFSVLVIGPVFFWLVYQYLAALNILSPLCKLPAAHWSVRISSRWLDRSCATDGELKTLYAVHNRLGPIVRIGLNEVSVVSEEGLRKVYVGGLDKSDWYERVFRVYDKPNLVSILDHKTHASVRRMIAGLYTKSYLQHAMEMQALSERIVHGRLLPDLHRCAQSARNTNVMELFECIAVDFVTGHIFGNSLGTDFLDDEGHRKPYLEEWKKVGVSSAHVGRPLTEALILDKCRTAIRNYEHNKSGQGDQRTVAVELYKGLCGHAGRWGLDASDTITQCSSEMADHVIATQETVSVTWTYIYYRLSQRPDLQERLRAELQTLTFSAAGRDHGSVLPEPANIEKLPLLDSIVKETLRLHAANPARMRRVVPSAGLLLHGYFLPPRTIISSNAYCLHRNESAFPRPLEWEPERWLSSGGGKSGDLNASSSRKMRDWLWAFGSGPRGCIGQHFALQIIKLVVAVVYSEYVTTIIEDDGIEQSDSYNSAPISHKLVLRFVPLKQQ